MMVRQFSKSKNVTFHDFLSCWRRFLEHWPRRRSAWRGNSRIRRRIDERSGTQQVRRHGANMIDSSVVDTADSGTCAELGWGYNISTHRGNLLTV